jgi:nitrate reductase NapD
MEGAPADRLLGAFRRSEEAHMVISGIVVASKPEDLSAVSAAVEQFSWADVHASDSVGRLVVTIEAEDIDESMERLKQLKQLPRVLMAELALYTIDDGEDSHDEV